jgi:hypothetical protein
MINFSLIFEGKSSEKNPFKIQKIISKMLKKLTPQQRPSIPPENSTDDFLQKRLFINNEIYLGPS